MIVGFNLVPVKAGLSLLVAILLEDDPVQIGVFEDDDTEEIEAACEEFTADHKKQLH
jgi:hypothetical protein